MIVSDELRSILNRAYSEAVVTRDLSHLSLRFKALITNLGIDPNQVVYRVHVRVDDGSSLYGYYPLPDVGIIPMEFDALDGVITVFNKKVHKAQDLIDIIGGYKWAFSTDSTIIDHL